MADPADSAENRHDVRRGRLTECRAGDVVHTPYALAHIGDVQRNGDPGARDIVARIRHGGLVAAIDRHAHSDGRCRPTRTLVVLAHCSRQCGEKRVIHRGADRRAGGLEVRQRNLDGVQADPWRSSREQRRQRRRRRFHHPAGRGPEVQPGARRGPVGAAAAAATACPTDPAARLNDRRPSPIRSRTPAAARLAALGGEPSGCHGACSRRSTSGRVSTIAAVISINPRPSASEWCTFRMTPKRPSAIPSTRCSSHSGRSLSKACIAIGPARSSSARSDPSPGAPTCRMWNAGSKS